MITYYCIYGMSIYLVTADNVQLAKQLLRDTYGIQVNNEDLFNVITSSRWTKVLTPDPTTHPSILPGTIP